MDMSLKCTFYNVQNSSNNLHYKSQHNASFSGKKKRTKKFLNKPQVRNHPCFDSVFGNIYPKPVTLKKALYDILNDAAGEVVISDKKKITTFLNDLQNVKNILNKKVNGVLGQGRNSIVFDTQSGKVIKITKGNHFPMNRPLQPFDVPVYKKGHFKNTYFYIEEKLYQHGLSRQFVSNVINDIEEKGFKASDLASSDFYQVGLSKNGKLYLLDPECAEYKTIFHAVWDKLKISGRKLIKLFKRIK